MLSLKKERALDPSSLRFFQEYIILDNITAKLVGTGSNEEYFNDLAKSLNFSEDKKTITIRLREAYFSDGSRITSTDVAKSLKRAVIFGTPHTNISDLWVGSKKLKTINDEIEGIKVLSKSEIQLKLTRETKELLFYFTLTDLAILHKSQYSKKALKVSDWTKNTSGPFHIEFNKDDKLTLVSNTKALNFRKEMPKVVVFGSYKGDDVIMRLKNRSLDFGLITFRDYINNIEKIESVKGFDIISEKTDGIIYMTLNMNSKLFSKEKNRQWIQQKIIKNFQVSKPYERVSSKAFQFFLPNAKGYVPDAKIQSILSQDVDTSIIPEDLKKGLKIRTIEGMKYFMPGDISQSLTKALGIPVEVDITIPSKNYMDTIVKKRDYDATIIAVGMYYKVLGEALNLQYLSKSPYLLDPTGNIKNLLKEYQKEEDLDRESKIISQILKQMVVDSECIPLFYFASPFFIKQETISSTNLNLEKTIQFSNMVVN